MQKKINFDDFIKENIKESNSNCLQIADNSYRILLTEGFRSRKTNSLFNLINHQRDYYKTYLRGKDLYEAEYQWLLTTKESTGIKYFNDPKVFIKYSSDMDDNYNNI